MSAFCPCGSGQIDQECCLPYLRGEKKALTPEVLMRSRYTAFSKRKFAYLVKTMRGEASKEFDLNAVRRDAPLIKWLKLEVLTAEAEEELGAVEFKAYYRFQKRDVVLHEYSRFEKIAGEWFYMGRK